MEKIFVNKIDEVDEIKEYLDTIVDVLLLKKQREELINVINLRDNLNRQQKSVDILNAYLQEIYQMQLISKKVKIEGRKRRVTVWEVSIMGEPFLDE